MQCECCANTTRENQPCENIFPSTTGMISTLQGVKPAIGDSSMVKESALVVSM
jgi:hypothetical protein